ncbi:protein spaetzle 4 isoform X2 [Harpegnathos saltator]|uniref:Spaetzle domain-containing protein n=1 Tax=Harpegnathos saltator TaxID=610380 RepID=E2BCP3_HARSA|nr:protein spaetzle 4 isoform X2 [Harpegnathos saltator]EFN86553.1 hypothetical protein EAI_04391 [Harpegnathos saltator]
MKAIAFFLLQVSALQLPRCRGGGPSTFGYDASSACSKPYSRVGRAHHEDLPCDFRRQNWCTIPGSAYPWHAVRRFVQENQGLMRRMYGDESYISVLRAEFDKNDIELKYDDYHHFADELRQFQYEDDDYDEFVDDERQALPKDNADEYEGRGFTSRSFNDPIAKRLNKFPKLSEYTRPHFKPTERITTSSIASSTTTTTTASTSTSATTFRTRVSSSTTPAASSSTEETLFDIQAPVTKSTKSPNQVTTEAADEDLAATNSTTTTATLSPSVTVAQIMREQNFSINEIPGQNDRIDENVEEETVEVVVHSENSDAVIEEDTTLESADTTSVSSELPLVEQEGEEEKEKVLGAATKTTVHETVVAAPSNHEQFRPRPEYRPLGVAETSSMSGQLYQDAAKEQPEQQVMKLRGVNACPVKEEVVAPFWANSTRGEVLALLNLYPFEQYVHWEKCTHENKQMYCRDGCKCEQQYRLHRLLAYDPNNECRGIFSDWFKFPSCCVCRCYDLPLEFRVTSRSPRTHKRRIKVQVPRDRYA